MLFVAGYLITFKQLSEFAWDYFIFTACSVLSCCLLLTRLNRSIQDTLPFWILLIVFLLAYFIKFYWIVLDPEVMEGGVYFNIAPSTHFSQYRAFVTTSYAFGSFCIVAWALIGYRRFRKQIRGTERNGSAGGAALLMDPCVGALPAGIALVLILITTYITYATGIAIMGVESVRLPFHLAGIIFYTRTAIIPALLLLAIWLCQRAGSTQMAKAYLMLLLGFGLSDMLLRSSRGALVGSILLWWFLSLTGGHSIRRKAYVLLGVLAVAVFFAYPFVAEFRNVRITSGSRDIIALLGETEKNLIGGSVEQVGTLIVGGFGKSLNRFTGIDMLMAFNASHIQPLGPNAWAMLKSSGLGEYLTRDIFGYTNTTTNAMAPGLLGWFFLLGGNPMVIMGTIGFTVLTGFLWKVMRRLGLRTLPVAQALFSLLLLTTAVDGGLDSLVGLTVLSWPVAIILCEFLFRSGLRRSSRIDIHKLDRDKPTKACCLPLS